jgi:hypothetical protein
LKVKLAVMKKVITCYIQHTAHHVLILTFLTAISAGLSQYEAMALSEAENWVSLWLLARV